jgi:hypothetical protein
MFVTFRTWPGDLQTAASSTSLLPISMQVPVASTETSRSTWLWGTPFLTATTVPHFLPRSGQPDKSDNLEPLMGFQMCL